MPMRPASEMKMRCTGICMKSPPNSFCEARAAVRAQLAGDVDAVGLAELARRVCGTRCSGDSCTGQPWMRVERACVGVAVFLEPALEQDHQLDLPPEGGPSSSSRRRPTSEPAAAALK